MTYLKFNNTTLRCYHAVSLILDKKLITSWDVEWTNVKVKMLLLSMMIVFYCLDY